MATTDNTFFAGRDGFVWWFGVVEDRNDPLALGRVRARVYGYHTEDKTKLPTIDLPWAVCVQPANSASAGGIGMSPTGPIEGSWVFGFWRDPDFMQEPMVMGTIPGINSAASAPSGQSPHDYSPNQELPIPKVATSTTLGDGTTTEFSTPADTTDSTVLVKINGVVQSAENNSPESENNMEIPPDSYYGDGERIESSAFDRSRHKTRLADRINEIAPELRPKFVRGVQAFLADNPDYDCSISYAYRSASSQQELYRAYKSGGPKAARPGSSWHNFGSAIDFVITTLEGKALWDNDLYEGIARSSFSKAGLKNDIENDSGHFYPTEFPKTVDSRLKTASITLSEYAAEKGVA